MCKKWVAHKLIKSLKIVILNDPDSTAKGTSETQKKKYQAALEAGEEEAQDLAIRYGKSTCLPICQAMQQKLPRELRDLVYDYLLYNPLLPGMNRVWQGETSQRCNGCHFHNNFSSSCRKHGLGHLRNVEYLGSGTVEELAEMWYRASEFELSQAYTLDTLVRENPWNVSFNPTTLINKVYVRISKRDILEKDDSENKWKVPTEISQNLKSILLPLFHIKAGAKIEVRIIVFHKDWEKSLRDPKDLIEALTPAFSICQKLVDQRFRVQMMQRWGTELHDQKTLITPTEWVEANRKRYSRFQ